MVSDEQPLRASVSGSVAYAYFEAGRERFGWLKDPTGLIGDVGDVGDVFAPEGRSTIGEVYWSVRLRRTRRGWRVRKALPWGPAEAARLATAMEWVGSQGYLVDFRDGRSSPGMWCNRASSARLIGQLAMSSVGPTSSALEMASMRAIDSGRK
jgi:hypothetical protein